MWRSTDVLAAVPRASDEAAMVRSKFYRYTLDGRYTPEAAIAALGEAAAHGQVVRIDVADKETHVIVAATTAPRRSAKFSGAVKLSGEVKEDDVRRAP